MNASELKEYIYENEKIEYVLDSLGCGDIEYHDNKEYWSASFPDGDNKQGINITNNKYLKFRSFSRGVSYSDGKDIYDVVSSIKNISFFDSVKYLHDLFSLSHNFSKSKPAAKKVDPLYIFKKHCNRCKKFNVAEIEELAEKELNDYVSIIHIDWFREGIMYWTAEKFGLAYSYKRKRMIIPLRHWQTGKLLGTNSRTMIDNYAELGIDKYYITPSYKKGMNLFGLYENKNSIIEKGYVVVYESEKSVLKRDSKNDATGVAISGKTMTDEQVRILIGLNVEIIIALDKDVSIQEVRHICEKFYKTRNVSYMFDKYNLLNEKESPADAINMIYNYLFKYRIHYGLKEHNEYIKELNNKK